MIHKQDIVDVAKSIRMHITDDHIDYVMRNYESSAREDEIWCDTVESLLYSIHQQQVESERPNPMDYEDSPEGDARYWDDYWGGDFDAMLYHDDIGDR
jgi:hypothetical protein